LTILPIMTVVPIDDAACLRQPFGTSAIFEAV
jgi:hypothetical protein